MATAYEISEENGYNNANSICTIRQQERKQDIWINDLSEQ